MSAMEDTRRNTRNTDNVNGTKNEENVIDGGSSGGNIQEQGEGVIQPEVTAPAAVTFDAIRMLLADTMGNMTEQVYAQTTNNVQHVASINLTHFENLSRQLTVENENLIRLVTTFERSVQGAPQSVLNHRNSQFNIVPPWSTSTARRTNSFAPLPRGHAPSTTHPSEMHRPGIDMGPSSNPANQTVTPPTTGLNACEYEPNTFSFLFHGFLFRRFESSHRCHNSPDFLLSSDANSPEYCLPRQSKVPPMLICEVGSTTELRRAGDSLCVPFAQNGTFV
ncbi:hypothetical protein Dimus_018777 [Dionaea muscipula]